MTDSNADLYTAIINACEQPDGLTFHKFMEMALYHPKLGYYQNSRPKFGAAGDFITAPHVSPIFGRCLAGFCQAQLAQLPKSAIIFEIGAGDGQLAVDVLTTLLETDHAPAAYWILEPSAYLQQVQKEKLQQALPDYFPQIKWLQTLPDTFDGVLIANEVLDALPVARFRTHPETHNIEEAYIVHRDGALQTDWQPPRTPHLSEQVSHLQQALPHPLPPGYQSEISHLLPGFIRSFAEKLRHGALLFIDYGFPQATYYHPQRSEGTLMCHHRHKTHANPLINIGEQDITAHVDFTALAEAAVANGLDVMGYYTQAQFLIACGLGEHLDASLPYPEQLKQSQAVQTLTLPHEMGELFKVMILGKGDIALSDMLQQQNQLHRL